MVLQEHVEREREASLGETARAAMAGDATIGEQFWRRFALIEILRLRRSRDCSHAKAEQAGEPEAPEWMQPIHLQPEPRARHAADSFSNSSGS